MNRRSSCGFGFLEIFIGLMLSSIILIAVGRYTVVRRITSMLRLSIWQAGFTPCMNLDRLISIDQRDSPVNLHAIDLDHGIKINRMSQIFSEVIEWGDPQTFTLKSRAGIMQDYPVIIADCEHAEVQAILSMHPTVTGTTLRVQHALAFTYTPPVYVGEWVEESFYAQQAPGQAGALFYKRHHVDRITERVHSLSVQAHSAPLGRLIKVTLGLDQARTFDLHAMVRAR